jgi:hypothetical protein
MRIDHLTLDLSGVPAHLARPFAAALERELAALPLPPDPTGRIARLDLPPVTARPGDTAESLARTTATAIGAALSGVRP